MEVSQVSGINNRRAIASLIFGRLIYAVNWFNFAAGFTLVARDMSQNVSGLGTVVGSFYLGVGLFQIPGGLLAAKIGPKRTAVYGTLLASAASLLTAVATDFSQLLVLRFLVGTGMAFVFAPGVILMARYFRERAEGFSVGLFNAAFYFGGALGIFGWAVLADVWGWRESLAMSGGIGLVTAALMLFLVPRDSIREDFAMELREIRRVVASRWLFLLGVGMFGVTGLSSLATAFMVYYLQGSLNASAALAGSVAALTLVASLAASPLFGMLHDKIRNPGWLVFLCGLTGIGGLELAGITKVSAAVFANLIVGFAAGGALTVGFSAARELAHAEYETLPVSCINSTQLFAGFLFPPVFSSTVVSFGYPAAWALSGLYVFPFIAVALLSKFKRFTGHAI
jgi:MFS family permease